MKNPLFWDLSVEDLLAKRIRPKNAPGIAKDAGAVFAKGDWEGRRATFHVPEGPEFDAGRSRGRIRVHRKVLKGSGSDQSDISRLALAK
jgi:hypothetical protein